MTFSFVSIENPKGRVPPARTWVNVKEKDLFCFSNYILPALDQTKLESLKNHEIARGYLYKVKDNILLLTIFDRR